MRSSCAIDFKPAVPTGFAQDLIWRRPQPHRLSRRLHESRLHIGRVFRSTHIYTVVWMTAHSIPGKGGLSPRSEAKRCKKHYIVRDRNYGWLCVLCGSSKFDYEDLEYSPCFPFCVADTPAKPAKPCPKPAPVNTAKTDAETAQQLQLAELAELEEQEIMLQQLLELEELEKGLLQQEQAVELMEEKDLAEAMRMSRAETRDLGSPPRVSTARSSSSTAASSWEGPKVGAVTAAVAEPKVPTEARPQVPKPHLPAITAASAEVPAEAGALPTKLPAQAPAEPEAEVPTKPVAVVPTEPVAEVPTKPVAEVPTKMVAEVLTETVAEVPTETVAEVPTEPKAVATESAARANISTANVMTVLLATDAPAVEAPNAEALTAPVEEVAGIEVSSKPIAPEEPKTSGSTESFADVQLLQAKAFPQQNEAAEGEKIAAEILERPVCRRNTLSTLFWELDLHVVCWCC